MTSAEDDELIQGLGGGGPEETLRAVVAEPFMDEVTEGENAFLTPAPSLIVAPCSDAGDYCHVDALQDKLQPWRHSVDHVEVRNCEHRAVVQEEQLQTANH